MPNKSDARSSHGNSFCKGASFHHQIQLAAVEQVDIWTSEVVSQWISIFLSAVFRAIRLHLWSLRVLFPWFEIRSPERTLCVASAKNWDLQKRNETKQLRQFFWPHRFGFHSACLLPHGSGPKHPTNKIYCNVYSTANSTYASHIQQNEVQTKTVKNKYVRYISV